MKQYWYYIEPGLKNKKQKQNKKKTTTATKTNKQTNNKNPGQKRLKKEV